MFKFFFIKMSLSLQRVLLCYGWRGQFVDVKVVTKFQCQQQPRHQQLHVDCILVTATSGTRLTTKTVRQSPKHHKRTKTALTLQFWSFGVFEGSHPWSQSEADDSSCKSTRTPQRKSLKTTSKDKLGAGISWLSHLRLVNHIFIFF